MCWFLGHLKLTASTTNASTVSSLDQQEKFYQYERLVNSFFLDEFCDTQILEIH